MKAFVSRTLRRAGDIPDARRLRAYLPRNFRNGYKTPFFLRFERTVASGTRILGDHFHR
jgi:hypothetical protein